MTASDNANDDTKAVTALYDEKPITELAQLTVVNGKGSGLYPIGAVVPVSADVRPGYLFKEWQGPVADPTSANTTIKVSAEGATITAVLTKLGDNLALNKNISRILKQRI